MKRPDSIRGSRAIHQSAARWRYRSVRTLLVAAALGLLVAACGSTGPAQRPAPTDGGPVAQTDPYRPYLVGNPYRINGQWYEPREDFSYDREGMASWYGPNFHGRRTANGETYDMNQLTAAHTTLPMPSIVRVTNLSNGQSVVVRINDRGPYAHDRIIDLSRAAAARIGMLRDGVTRVRVQLLRAESLYLKAQAEAGRPTHRLAASIVQRANEGGETLTAENRRAAEAARRETDDTWTADAEREQEDVPERVEIDLSEESEGERAVVEREPIYRDAGRRENAENRAERDSEQTFRNDSRRGDMRTEQTAASAPRIFVQAGAFSEASNAERVGARLSHLGSTVISPVTVRETVYYRVRVGPVTSAEEGDQLLARVVRSGYPNARIVVE